MSHERALPRDTSCYSPLAAAANGSAPHKQGLYDPAFEHDACGVAFVVDVRGRRSHDMVEQGPDRPAQPRSPRRVRQRPEHR